ncbi:MAG TPA: hypothetical protein VF471_09725 [Pseudoxanthomonas sp.]
MATARKTASKAYERNAAKKVVKKIPKKKIGGAKGKNIVEKVRVELSAGRFIDILITVASGPKVGPGPRPNIQETVLLRRIDDEQVLTISAELGRHATAGIKVAPGKPPTGGN